jgi:P-type Ca2+ transporter type 2C
MTPTDSSGTGHTSLGRPIWHAREVKDVLDALGTTDGGLSSAAARERLAALGRNELIERGGRSLGQIVWEQVKGVMILILVAAAVLALVLGKPGDAIAILAIVVLFVVLGVVQEYRAQKAIAALKQMSAPTVRALRDGQVVEISAAELVPGDVVKLENGGVVPADCRVIESVNLRCQESALTGESEPVEKATAALADPALTVGDRVNLAYMGTFVSFGRGLAVVVETGMRTELGTIASLIQGVRHDTTPLQRKLDRLAKTLAVAALAIAGLVLVGDLLQGIPLHDGLLVAVAVAVAIVPEGLPAVLTFTLALGAQRMLRRKALIRKLPAVETLGSVTVICSDKTGTLTQNKMAVTVLDLAGLRLDVAVPAGPGGALGADRAPARLPGPAAAPFLLAAASLCNDATLDVDAASGPFSSVGDPTESALVLAAARFGLIKRVLDAALPRVAELPFDSERKRMTTLHRLPPGAAAGEAVRGAEAVTLPPGLGEAPLLAVVKGAVEGLLARVTSIWTPEGVVPFDESWKRRVLEGNEAMGSRGMRVLAVGYRGATEAPRPSDHDSFEQGLTLVGLAGMIDPPRPEARDAVSKCRAAGIRTIMITGDHPLTARSIAADLGITSADGVVTTGVELERLSAAELRETVRACNVFARVSPEHKLRLVDALQTNGEVVAMTGDGVNDAPALKKADIGVAMGITGTDVAKEAADMVLLDDNFATIVAAVEEGRIVYDNLRRFVLFSVAGNIGKVMIVAIPPLLGLPKLLVAIQILFSNLLTDGLVGLGLGVEKGESNVMRRPPYRPDEGVFSRGYAWHVAWLGPLIGVLVIAVAWWVHGQATTTGALDSLGRHALEDAEERHLITMVFLVLSMIQLTRVFGVRSFVDSCVRYTFRGNPTLLGLVAAAFVLQMLAVYFPPMQGFFQTTGAVGWEGLALGLGLGAAVLCAMEIEKALRRRRLAGGGPRRSADRTASAGDVTARRAPTALSPP